jgi:flagellar biosynthesis protein FlhA
VVDASTIIATHLSELVRKHAYELIGRQDLQGLIQNIEKTHPKVVEELIPKLLPLGDVLKVTQNLLREQVPVRDLLTILETLANYAPKYKDPDVLTEFVRAALARTITNRLTHGAEELEVLTLDARTEETLLRGYQRTDSGSSINLEPGAFEKLVHELQNMIERTAFSSGNAVLLCHPMIRSQLKRLLERFIPNLNIVSANEIANSARVRSLGAVAA